MLANIQFFFFSILVLACLCEGFINPIRSQGADPDIKVVNGAYYLTMTEPPATNQVSIYKSTTLDGLKNTVGNQIWSSSSDRDSSRNQMLWAPEMWNIDGVWYIFYSSGGSAANSNRCRVLKGCDAAAPDACSYSYMQELTPPAGSRGGSDKNDAFCIDGTFLELGGKRYNVVSAKDASDHQAIQISELDTSSTPWTVAGWNVISSPDQTWEQQGRWINEGPHPLTYNGSTWLSYSGSACESPDYAIGMLQYTGGNADPLLGSSWLKLGRSLHYDTQQDQSKPGIYGTGHNSFFPSPDGTETWNVFHATQNAGGDCSGGREIHAQDVTFASWGEPSLGGIPSPLSDNIVPPSGDGTGKL